MDTKTKKRTVAEVRAVCKELGLPFKRIADTGEFVVAGYFTDDAQDAIDTAFALKLGGYSAHVDAYAREEHRLHLGN